MGENKLFGMLLTKEQMTLPEEEREKYLILKELSEDYCSKTFKEVTEFLIKNPTALTNEQRVVADQTRSYLQQHNPPNNTCFFVAYKQDGEDIAAVKGLDGKEKQSIDAVITHYIDTRKTADGTEYRCVDMMVDFLNGDGYRDTHNRSR